MALPEVTREDIAAVLAQTPIQDAQLIKQLLNTCPNYRSLNEDVTQLLHKARIAGKPLDMSLYRLLFDRLAA